MSASDDIRNICLSPEDNIADAINNLNRSFKKIVLIVDAEARLVGTLTDGDVRRAFLDGRLLQTPLAQVMHLDPVVAAGNRPDSVYKALFQSHGIDHLPIVDEAMHLLDLKHVRDFVSVADSRESETTTLIFAGGYGKRLKPLTDTIPKPLVRVRGKPVLERLIEDLVRQDLRSIKIAVHYRAEDIMAHFGNGERIGARISYLVEEKPLGTGGALSLLDGEIGRTILALNADLDFQLDFSSFLEAHQSQGHWGTVGVRPVEIDIPYGVITETDAGRLDWQEKPCITKLVSAGVYALDSNVRALMPVGEALDMPDLFDRIQKGGNPVGCFACHEGWIDIGSPADLSRANGEG